jgi:virulence-associated protein VagC
MKIRRKLSKGMMRIPKAVHQELGDEVELVQVNKCVVLYPCDSSLEDVLACLELFSSVIRQDRLQSHSAAVGQ